jgi:hypothetical protein
MMGPGDESFKRFQSKGRDGKVVGGERDYAGLSLPGAPSGPAPQGGAVQKSLPAIFVEPAF